MSDEHSRPALTVESFVAHRLWRLIPHGPDPILASVTSGDPWLGPQLSAECFAGVLLQPRARRVVTNLHRAQLSPSLDCTCGLYASKEAVSPQYRMVWGAGRVRLWGRVIEGSAGYRGQHARIFDDVKIYLGMGPGTAMCTLPPCRRRATGVWVGSTSFLARCGRHDRGRAVGFGDFETWVNSSFRQRYGVGAFLAQR